MHRRVLVIDDDTEFQRALGPLLAEDGIVLVSARTEAEAQERFRDADGAFGAIALDGNLTGNGQLDTLDLLTHLRAAFGGTIVAISSDSLWRLAMVEQGCDRECKKGELPGLLTEILGAHDAPAADR